MKPSEIIDKALTEVIPDESRWIQQKPHQLLPGGVPQFCVTGALAVAHHGYSSPLLKAEPIGLDLDGWSRHYMEPEELQARQAIVSAIRELPGHDDDSVTSYNDAHDRTYDEVRMVMEKGRAALQEKGM